MVLALAALVTCTEPESTTGSVTGSAKDSRTNEPLAGVGITLKPLGLSMTTSADGLFEFDDITAQSYTIQAMKANYETVEKSVQVVVGGHSRVDLLLTPSLPILEVKSRTLDFGAETTTLTIDIANSGYSKLEWQVSENVSWLSCLPTSGSTQPDGNSSVVVTVNRSGLERGSYSQTIVITSNGGSATIQVTLSVEGSMVDVTPQELDFGTVESSKTIALTNRSKSSAKYSVTSSNSWIYIGKREGTFAQTEIIAVSVIREGLSEGNYSGSLTFLFGKDELVVPVKMTVLPKIAPVVLFANVESITDNSAFVSGSIISIGSSAVTRHGFCWSQDTNPTIEKGLVCNMGDANSAHDFSYNIPRLEADTKYYVRAYAENAVGVSYSDEISFVTKGLPTKASVETGSVRGIEWNKAEVTGNLLSLGNVSTVTQYGHVWSNKPGPTTANLRSEFGSTDKLSPFTTTINDLEPNTTYYVRAYADNEKGTAYGEEITFTTSPKAVELITVAASGITASGAVCGGNITELGGNVITERGVCWSTSGTPVLENSHAYSTESGNSYTCTVSGLAEKTSYNIRAYVKTQDGRIYYASNTLSFKTTHIIYKAMVADVQVSGVAVDKASLSSSVTSTGEGTITDCGFCWSETAGVDLSVNKVSYGTSTGTFGRTITGLSENTKYYVRAYVTNEAGTSYSAETSFTTLPITVPVVGTVIVSALTPDWVDLTASISSTGYGTISDAGFCLSENPYPTVGDYKASTGTQGNLSKRIEGLTVNKTYYVRAYAVNEKGTTYGAEATFTVPEGPKRATVSMGAVTEITATGAKASGTLVNMGNVERVTQHGHVWSTTSVPTLENSSKSQLGQLTAVRAFSSTLTGLKYATTYYIRPYATNSQGTAYGEEITFTTLYGESSLSTATVSNLRYNEAKAGGTAVETGGHTVKECGIYWGTAANPATTGAKVVCALSGTSFSTTITELTEKTNYYVIAYMVLESDAVVYGTERSFTTPAKDEQVSIDDYEDDEDWSL